MTSRGWNTCSCQNLSASNANMFWHPGADSRSVAIREISLFSQRKKTKQRREGRSLRLSSHVPNEGWACWLCNVSARKRNRGSGGRSVTYIFTPSSGGSAFIFYIERRDPLDHMAALLTCLNKSSPLPCFLLVTLKFSERPDKDYGVKEHDWLLRTLDKHYAPRFHAVNWTYLLYSKHTMTGTNLCC